ncbi:hypothetical protein Patl1_13756 [Pistacia atlantica]|uniref:Uncharacterized protein n=1 Tax=Pistacia atlantica TaxID=434234 RepID=A0ACC1AYB5_9ROSI|nr:hypothetical protein Patl1_13756 [Pistacia atlantica]
MIDSNTPRTEITAETSAAMAASSIVFRTVDPETSAAMAASSIAFRTVDHHHSRRLLNEAKLLFEFAISLKGTYDGECLFYCSYSGYNVHTHSVQFNK